MSIPLQSSPTLLLLGGLLLVFAVVTAYKSVIIVNAYEKKALTVFGKYRRLLDPGINLVVPYISATYTFDMRTETMDVPQQEAITRM